MVWSFLKTFLLSVLCVLVLQIWLCIFKYFLALTIIFYRWPIEGDILKGIGNTWPLSAILTRCVFVGCVCVWGGVGGGWGAGGRMGNICDYLFCFPAHQLPSEKGFTIKKREFCRLFLWEGSKVNLDRVLSVPLNLISTAPKCWTQEIRSYKKYKWRYLGTSKHTTSQQRRYKVAASLWRCSDVVRTLFGRCVFTGEPSTAYPRHQKERWGPNNSKLIYFIITSKLK